MAGCFVYRNKALQRSFGFEIEVSRVNKTIKVKAECIWTARFDGSDRFLPNIDDKTEIEQWFADEVLESKELQNKIKYYAASSISA